MNKEIKIILTLSVILAFVLGLDFGNFIAKSFPESQNTIPVIERTNTSKIIEERVEQFCGGLPANRPGSDCGFFLAENGYAGWEMGCNYALGSDENRQEYLKCANN